MTAECTGGRELAELVADHFLGDVDGHMLAAVMHGDGVAHEIGEDGGRTRPGLNVGLSAGIVHICDALVQALTYIRAFFD